MRLLLVEDEKRMAQALCEILRLEKYEVDHFLSGVDGLAAIESNIYDIVILDVMLPGMNGFEVAKKARSKGITTPILMLTAKAELDDKVNGLDSGADDYLTKPFMTKELLARIRALGRRRLGTTDGILSFGDIALDTGTLTLSCVTNGQNVRLGEKEYRILEYLIANSSQVLSREQLAVKIWGFESEAEYEEFCARHAKATLPEADASTYTGDAYLGIDCGSTTTKLLLLSDDKKILYTYYSSNQGNPVHIIKEQLAEIYRICGERIRIRGSAVTGYGEELIRHAFHLDHGLVETMAHFFPARMK